MEHGPRRPFKRALLSACPPVSSSHSRASSTASSTGAGSILPPANTNGYPTGRPIPSTLLRNGRTLIYPVFTPRRTSAKNDNCKPRFPPFLSLFHSTQPWYIPFTRTRAGSNTGFKNFDLFHPCRSAGIISANRSRPSLPRERR